MMKRIKVAPTALLFFSSYIIIWLCMSFICYNLLLKGEEEEGQSLIKTINSNNANGNVKNDNAHGIDIDVDIDVDIDIDIDVGVVGATDSKDAVPETATVPKQQRRRHRPILTAYLSMQNSNDGSNQIKAHEYPQAYAYLEENDNNDNNNNNNNDMNTVARPFPIIDDYPDGDSFLPWIHDLHQSSDGTSIQLYAQNRRRCHTGEHHVDLMKEMEGQIALFQPVPVTTVKDPNSNSDSASSSSSSSYRISNYEEANPESKETRFICRFKYYKHPNINTNANSKTNSSSSTTSSSDPEEEKTWITFSKYPFNYEYVSWRKRMDGMFQRDGKDMAQFWLSSLQFECPIPKEVQIRQQKQQQQQQQQMEMNEHSRNGKQREDLYLDIVPIRTPVRYNTFFFHKGHGGPVNFDIYKQWDRESLHIPPIETSTRWENIYIQPLKMPWQTENKSNRKPNNMDVVALEDDKKEVKMTKKKPFELVACTWTSASHNRRGDGATITDGKERLQEWIAFHLLVGFDHIVVYDNTGANSNPNETTSTLKDVTDKFGPNLVTHVDWPCKICNNNKPANADPGERSSQYAAEASCRGRFAPYTEWMSFMDPDEYFVPMGKYNNWKEVLSDVDKEGRKILKFRSTRARPNPNLMVPIYYGPDARKCPTVDEVNGDKLLKASCLIRDQKYTFLQTYNCEYIKSPKPERFQRAMKQMYRPDYVLSHFVHYSTVTADLARTREETKDGKYDKYKRTSDPKTERFIDEINEGVMIHAKTMVPEEAVPRDARCKLGLHPGCNVAIPCPDDLPFDDKTHQGGFQDRNGNYCNCWMNRKVSEVWLPKLESRLEQLEEGAGFKRKEKSATIV